MADLREAILAVLADAAPATLTLYRIRTAVDERFPSPPHRFLWWSWRLGRTPTAVLNELDRLRADGLVRAVWDPTSEQPRRLYWLASRRTDG